MAAQAYALGAKIGITPAELLSTPLALVGHLIAVAARVSGKPVYRRTSTTNAKKILQWAAKNYAP